MRADIVPGAVFPRYQLSDRVLLRGPRRPEQPAHFHQGTDPRPGQHHDSEGNLMDAKLEVIVIPVADVDRSLQFYRDTLGWRPDADFSVEEGYRIVQVTPPGSPCSVIFGDGVTTAAPGSVQGLYLVVTDIQATRDELAGRGVAVSEVFHDRSGVFNRAGDAARVAGPDPEGRSYTSHASFADPDGNEWILQQVTERLPGR